jgi:two-component system response regulator WspF
MPQPGVVLLASGDSHLRVAPGGELVHTDEPAGLPYRPSVDVLFHSVAQHWRGPAVGVLLTGMGNDGAQGLKAMRERGFSTIAQDRASSAVWGMPKAAAELGAAMEVLPLSRIAGRLVALCP